MELDKIIVLIAGSSLMAFVYWFFFMKKDEAVKADNEIDILVSGGYKPSVVEVKPNQNIKLNFIRKDPSDCLEEVILSDFKIKRYLPLNEKVTIEINPKVKGEYKFSCGMNMYHGKLIVS